MKLIGLTGPSSFTVECVRMVEHFFDANPILLYQNRWEHVEDHLSRCSAVVLAGGLDIHPRTYNYSCIVGKNMRQFDYRRDQREVSILSYCVDNAIPVLGICRGLQMIGVARKKMELLPDIAGDAATVIHSPQRQDPKFESDKANSVHHVTVLRERFPEKTLWVNSFHHQGLKYEADKHDRDADVAGIAPINDKESIVEMMTSESEKWVAVQWHPEWDYEEQESSRRVLQHFKDKFLNNPTLSHPRDSATIHPGRRRPV